MRGLCTRALSGHPSNFPESSSFRYLYSKLEWRFLLIHLDYQNLTKFIVSNLQPKPDMSKIYYTYSVPKPQFVTYRLHMATQIWVNIGSGNGVLPDCTKPLPDPMLTYHQWGSVAYTREQFHRTCSMVQTVTWIRNVHLQNYCHISKGSMSKYLSLYHYNHNAIWLTVWYQTKFPWRTLYLSWHWHKIWFLWTISKTHLSIYK